MPKIYTKNTWTDELLADDPVEYSINGEEGVTIELVTDVITPGSPVNADRMNNIEEGIDGLDDKVVGIDDYLLGTPTEKTVSTGVLAVDKSRHSVQPESGTEDDIDVISGMPVNSHLTLYASDWGTDTLTFKHGTGNISCFGGADVQLSEGFVICFYDGTFVYLSGGGGEAPKGFVEFISNAPPGSSAATFLSVAGASTPAEAFPYFVFVDGSTTYYDFVCRLRNYNGGGLTFDFDVLRTSAAAGEAYSLEMAINRLVGKDILASHTYDYNAVSVTVPAGPPAAGVPMAATITFADGADMDSLQNNEIFILRIRRIGGSDTANDVARVLTTISGRET
jgi:hypothetical protein